MRPDKINEYTAAAEKYFGSMKIRKEGQGGSDAGCELMGSWQTVVGDLDTFGTDRSLAPSFPSAPSLITR